MTRPVCPLCARDDEVVEFVDEEHPEAVSLMCEASECASYSWTPRPEPTRARTTPQRTRIGEELDVYADLLTCIESSEQWLEWGVIEHRYRGTNPRAYKAMIDRWGHRAAGGDPKFTVSNFLAGCVGQLGSEGLVTTRRGPTTGYWSYLPAATQATGVPAAPDAEQLTWTAYAAQHGLDPDAWAL